MRATRWQVVERPFRRLERLVPPTNGTWHAAPLAMSSRFRDRRDAGAQLAASLEHYANRPDVIILALPRGGVPIAYEVATRLGVPLDIFVVRKLGLPGREEFAIGAIASGGARILNRDVIRFTHLSDDDIARITAMEHCATRNVRGAALHRR